ncbi:MAG TPA: hypothetical protein VGC32_16925 [Solirubrobacterales bacterium]
MLAELGRWLGEESGGCTVGVEEARASAPSSTAKGTARRSSHLYCAKGRELVADEPFGYDYTADFCRRPGFPIHHPVKTALNHS